jgi:hypothetical protein
VGPPFQVVRSSSLVTMDVSVMRTSVNELSLKANCGKVISVGLIGFLSRLSGIAGRIARGAEQCFRLGSMYVSNRFERSPVTQPGGPVVSLTTFGKRAQTVHFALESIGRGQLRPSRLILWLDDAALLGNLPAGIRRLQKRGLEVKGCKDYGPHKKYYPYLESLEDFKTPLVTADDDLIYPRVWLKRLAEAFQQFPEAINCHRARLLVLNQDRVAEYGSWGAIDSTDPSFRHVATGVAGVIYPPRFQRALKQKATGFVNCCPRADDLWLHVQALRSGYKVRQISRKRFRHVYIPGTQSDGLIQQNVLLRGNDLQVEATYQAPDIERMREGDCTYICGPNYDVPCRIEHTLAP